MSHTDHKHSALVRLGLVVVLLVIPGTYMRRVANQNRLNSALFSATMYNNTQEVVYLLQQGADPNAMRSEIKNESMRQLLIDYLRGKPLHLVTPLIAALHIEYNNNGFPEGVRTENVPLVAALLDYGANVNFTDRFGRTPLLLAIQASHNATIHLLLARGADVRARAKYARSWSDALLIDAAMNVDVECGVLTDLLDHGADVNMTDSDGSTALHIAAENCRVEEVRELLAHHANTTITDKQGRTPLAIAQQFLAYAVNANDRDNYKTIVNLLKQSQYLLNNPGQALIAPNRP